MAAAGAVVFAQSGDDAPARDCRYDHRPPLPGDIHRSIGGIEAGARRVLRRDAHDPRSAFARVLAGSRYAVDDYGYISGGEHGWHGRAFRVTGVTAEVRVITPHGFDAILPEWEAPWPRRSPNHRYSRHYGYLPYKVRAVSKNGVTGLWVDVDMRTRRVIGIIEGVDSQTFDRWEVLPGHCPFRPAPPGD